MFVKTSYNMQCKILTRFFLFRIFIFQTHIKSEEKLIGQLAIFNVHSPSTLMVCRHSRDFIAKWDYALGLEVGVTAVVRNNRRRQNTWKNDVKMITLIWKMDQYMMCWLFPVARYQSRITCIRLSDWWNLTASIEVWTSVSDRWKNRGASFVFFS